MANTELRAQYTQMDPDFVALLKTLPPAPPLPLEAQAMRNMTVERAKARAAATTQFLTPDVEEEDSSITGRDGHSIRIRIYRPKTPPAQGSPLIVMLHGGGFVVGTLESEQINCRQFSHNFGAVCVNVDYRLAPEHPFPAAPNDTWDAVKWCADNATSKLKADPSKGFLVGGTSAGGNLTDVVAHQARDEGLTPPLTGLLELGEFLPQCLS